jgi:hypothetical protein
MVYVLDRAHGLQLPIVVRVLIFGFGQLIPSSGGGD